MKGRRVLSVIGAVVGGAIFVTGCGPEEQARPLNYKKGVYLGAPHTPLDEQTLDDLRARAGYQAGLSAGSGGGGGGMAGTRAPSSNVRPPATDGLDADALRRRSSRQSQ